eukprot:TRINITY_DN561_c0_g1_i3.p2 TRINITY_DN561_c0_g1~~TRINITY_DN561_c0_g1_i3.p2  ORF type:complete len:113 (+),score=27.39 TRINITY_DN561_c0_g1_i3:70-408(+)
MAERVSDDALQDSNLLSEKLRCCPSEEKAIEAVNAAVLKARTQLMDHHLMAFGVTDSITLSAVDDTAAQLRAFLNFYKVILVWRYALIYRWLRNRKTCSSIKAPLIPAEDVP